MKPTSYLINVARGGLVDTDALVAALSAGALGGAALDVLEHEPPAPDDPLLGVENVILCRHAIALTDDFNLAVGASAIAGARQSPVARPPAPCQPRRAPASTTRGPAREHHVMTPGSQFRNFELELWQSAHEQDVRYELADSGVPAISLMGLRALGLDLDSLLELPLHYPEVNGTRPLRARIAALYPTLAPDHALVTVGAAEAGAVVIDALTEPGDRIAFMRPDYQQLTGLASNRRRESVTFSLDPEQDWALDIDQLQRACAPGVRLISLSNPNNPTGKVLSSDERLAVLDVARRHDAWLLADEVYIGTEHDGDETETLLGHYQKTVVISSLSKAYGLSGLRLGWVVGPQEAVAACWRRHEYATIATSALSMRVGEFALEPSNRAALFDRSRRYIAAGHGAINEWASTTDAVIWSRRRTRRPWRSSGFPPRCGRWTSQNASLRRRAFSSLRRLLRSLWRARADHCRARSRRAAACA